MTLPSSGDRASQLVRKAVIRATEPVRYVSRVDCARVIVGWPATGEIQPMLLRILAVFALVALPFDVSLWYRSHRDPMQYRWDLTLYNSVHVHVRDGVCGLLLVTMPEKTASRTYFQTPLNYDPVPNQASIFASSRRNGPYWNTWLAFPFWLPTLFLALVGIAPILQGPVRRWWLHRQGRCVVCGYDLRGTEGNRCSECGLVFREDAASERAEAPS